MIDLQGKSLKMRRKIIRLAYLGGTGHIASSLSSLDIIVALYCSKVLVFDAKNPLMSARDRFILSKGHAAMALYNVLCEEGFFSWNELKTFCKPGTIFGGEPTHIISGVECATGALGHGLSFGVGMALSAKIRKQSHLTYVLTGDGECQEGSIWEAAMSIAQNNLNNLIWIIDRNNLQATGRINKITDIDPLEVKLKSFGFNVVIIDGHNYDELVNTFNDTKKQLEKPLVIIANTIKGQGISLLEDKDDNHYKIPNLTEYKIIVDELGLTWEEFERL
ncbi:transketolase, N-terminal subunit [Bacteroidia bacterium]|nr:transketolase, N-terminal subunit [Bacteroidia bacterium]